jgi:ethanolamine utilization protein EutN
MILARVVGTVVATRKDPRLEGRALMVLQPIDPEGKPQGSYVVAVNTVNAGVGERVIAVSGSSARMAEGCTNLPTDCSIVGIVDEFSVVTSEASKREIPSRNQEKSR